MEVGVNKHDVLIISHGNSGAPFATPSGRHISLAMWVWQVLVQIKSLDISVSYGKVLLIPSKI